ncbi:hypothetical protein [Escherichia albertii]|uniref:hypothetical protein n=1 Tax=Escherichia albertii TaxID=208962 RepID=UPI0002B998C0
MSVTESGAKTGHKSSGKPSKAQETALSASELTESIKGLGLPGYSSRHVQRMLKLADLAPVILDELAEDRITTEHCQVQVFEAA